MLKGAASQLFVARLGRHNEFLQGQALTYTREDKLPLVFIPFSMLRTHYLPSIVIAISRPAVASLP
jgi:hypothetical protein